MLRHIIKKYIYFQPMIDNVDKKDLILESLNLTRVTYNKNKALIA